MGFTAESSFELELRYVSFALLLLVAAEGRSGAAGTSGSPLQLETSKVKSGKYIPSIWTHSDGRPRSGTSI